MNMFFIGCSIGLGFVMFCISVYIILRVKIPEWAAQYRLFISPPFGRIFARIRAGVIVGYYGNLKGLGIHVDRETGKIQPGEEKIWSLLWRLFGARFIGLDSVHEYIIEITEMDKDNKPVTTTRTAHSLHYSGSYNLVIVSAESLEGTKLGLHIRFTLRTTHAGQCLKYKSNWIAVANSAIKAATRDFVGKRKVRELLAMQNELPDTATGGYVELIMSLNNAIKGNPGLIDTLGQEITAVNLESIEIEDGSVAKSLLEQEIAIEHGKGLVAIAAAEADKALEEKRKKETDAEAALFVERKKAEGELAHGEAENKILAGRVTAVGGADNMVQTKKWEAIGMLKELKGTLVLTEGSEKAPSLIVSASPANPKGLVTKA